MQYKYDICVPNAGTQQFDTSYDIFFHLNLTGYQTGHKLIRIPENQYFDIKF